MAGRECTGLAFFAVSIRSTSTVANAGCWQTATRERLGNAKWKSACVRDIRRNELLGKEEKAGRVEVYCTEVEQDEEGRGGGVFGRKPDRTGTGRDGEHVTCMSRDSYKGIHVR